MKAALIGIGDMGLNLARCLVRAGHEVTAFDLRAEAGDKAAALGAFSCVTMADAVKGAKTIGIVVLNDAQVRSVVVGADGLLSLLSPEQTVLIHSTVSPSTAIELAELARSKGIALLDAPVAGAGVRAENGNLAVLVGGEKDAVNACRSVLEAFGTVHHLGPVGSGQVVKLANNMVVAATKGVLYEAFSFARKYGIDEATLREALLQGSASSFLLENWAYFEGLLVNHTLAGTADFTAFMTKDIWSAVVAAHARNVDMPIASVAASTLARSLGQRISKLRASSPETGPRQHEASADVKQKESHPRQTWDKHSLIRDTALTFDPGDKSNGSLYICLPTGSDTGNSVMTAIEDLRKAGLWSTEEPKRVEDAQKPAYEQQLQLADFHFLATRGLLLARFDHPKYPSSPDRFSHWVKALA